MTAISAPNNTDRKTYLFGLTLFWIGVFILNAGPHWEVYSSTREMIETAGIKTSLQLLVAVITLNILVPSLMEKGHWLLFTLALFSLVVVMAEINIVIRYLYLEQRYPDSYKQFLTMFADMSLAQRMDLTWALRYILFTKMPQLTFPAVLIATYHFYQRQQTLLRLREQKISAELDALKNQLNPHFIFNTLNNIYALALKKSDQTPMAIEKLSAILDYVVYGCGGKFVDLDSEITLIENYVALEKIRYGKRLQFSLEIDVQTRLKIAPLILLTLTENACKHSTKEELNQAQVTVRITQKNNALTISVSNSKPANTKPGLENARKVGLANLTQQLELLYPDNHQFDINETSTEYCSVITLQLHSTLKTI